MPRLLLLLLSVTFIDHFFQTKAETFVWDQIFWYLWWYFFADQFSLCQFQDPATNMKFKKHKRDDSKTVVAVASALRWRICPAALARSANRGAALIIFIVDGAIYCNAIYRQKRVFKIYFRMIIMMMAVVMKTLECSTLSHQSLQCSLKRLRYNTYREQRQGIWLRIRSRCSHHHHVLLKMSKHRGELTKKQNKKK